LILFCSRTSIPFVKSFSPAFFPSVSTRQQVARTPLFLGQFATPTLTPWPQAVPFRPFACRPPFHTLQARHVPCLHSSGTFFNFQLGIYGEFLSPFLSKSAPGHACPSGSPVPPPPLSLFFPPAHLMTTRLFLNSQVGHPGPGPPVPLGYGVHPV